MQDDIGGDLKFVAAMIAGSVHKKQDQLVVIFLCQGLQKNLEAFGIGRRHDQEDASSVLRADSAIQIDVFTNELAGDLRPDADRCPARSRAVHPTEPRFIGRCASDGHAWRQPAELSSQHWENRFFKSVLSGDVAFGMEWTRHQLAPAMPGKKIVDRALAGRVPDGLFVGHLEIVDIQQLARPGGFGKAHQQGLFLSQGHVLALATAAWLASQRLEPAVVIGHMGPVHRVQRHSHRFRDHRLRHSALTQQHHLDTLALLGMPFPTQRCLQTPDLPFGAFDHLFPRIRSRWSERITPRLSNAIHPDTRCRDTASLRFNALWKRYKTALAKVQLGRDPYVEKDTARADAELTLGAIADRFLD